MIIQSKFGPVAVTVTELTHAYLSAGSSYDGPASAGLTLRGVRYHASVHLWYGPDGWTERESISNYDSLYISRSDLGRGMFDVSRPARRDILAALKSAFLGFIGTDAGNDALTAGEIEAARHALEAAREKYAEAETALSAALAARVAAAKRLKAAEASR